MTRPFRFGVNMVTPDAGEVWRRRCARAEELGYDVILVPDHLGMVAPFPALVAAAEATERPRLGTFVLNTAFWNPALLAREIATTDALTGGRLEVGIGTGYVREEHDRAGLEFLPPRERVDLLRRTVDELDRFLADETHLPRPAQRPRPPLLIAGNGDRVLRLAAERAEIAAFTGGRSTEDGIRVLTAEELDERVAAYQGFAAGRAEPAELNLLLQLVAVTTDPEAAVQGLRPLVPDLSEAEILDLPLVAVGTAKEIAALLRERRARFGFSYLTVLDPYMEAFASVIEELRGDCPVPTRVPAQESVRPHAPAGGGMPAWTIYGYGPPLRRISTRSSPFGRPPPRAPASRTTAKGSRDSWHATPER